MAWPFKSGPTGLPALPDGVPVIPGTINPGGQSLRIGESIPNGVDPNVPPGLDRPIGDRVTARNGLAAWDKVGPAPTDWSLLGAPSGGSAPPYVLFFSGPNPQGTPPNEGPGPQVNCGLWVPVPSVELGSCAWEAWLRPQRVANDVAEYFIAQGFGGGHSMLVGVQFVGGFFQLTGLYLKTAIASEGFQSQVSDRVNPDEWIHVVIVVDTLLGKTYVLLDGVVTWYVTNSGTGRYSPTDSSELFFGGHNHQDFKGYMARVTAWDARQNPIDVSQSEGPDPIRPWFTAREILSGASTKLPDGLWDMTAPGNMVTDLGLNQLPPLTGSRFRMAPLHPGSLQWSGSTFEQANEPPLYDRPQFVQDPTCPIYLPGPRVTANAYVKPASDPVPADIAATCLAWDSFGHKRSSFVETATPVLGTTEAGSLAPQTYAIRPQDNITKRTFDFGVLFGAGVYMGAGDVYGFAVVDFATANHGVQCRRTPGCIAGDNANHMGPVMCLRFIDGSNFWGWDWIIGQVRAFKMVAGVKTTRAFVGAIGTFDSVRMENHVAGVANDWRLSVGVNNAAWVVVDTWTDAALNTGTKGGLLGYRSFSRYDNWGGFST
ncbi:MAG TPA: LamG-like jellyroll fold domain-containing protein [Solirubrobacteraceae bacterium]|nr:LamG-like jellyroll fold domain-containing protein [Solirubrobacteraceae bacterium]